MLPSARPVKLPTLLRLFAQFAETAADALEMGTLGEEDIEGVRSALTGVAQDALAGHGAAVEAVNMLGGPYALLALAEHVGRACPVADCDGGVRICDRCAGTGCATCLDHGAVYCRQVWP